MTPSSNLITSRERFREVMRYGACDRVPYFEEGIRDDVLRLWRRQGLSKATALSQIFPTDHRIEFDPDLEPRPAFKKWPTTEKDLSELRRRLDPNDSRRLPKKWKQRLRDLKNQDTVRMLRVHRGLFLSMGVAGWDRFLELMRLLGEKPDMVREAMRIQGAFCAVMTEKVLKEVDIDAAIFSEPIGGNDRPLISPAMFDDIVLKSYEPVLKVLKRFEVKTIIFRTYANAKILIPKILERGINCLWACEVNIKAMDYRLLRRQFGKDLRLIGGIDLDALRRGKESIQRELNEKLPPLLADGGYIPLADGRVRPDVTFENYAYYRTLLQELT